MKTATKTYRVLVIGGRGYIGRHIAKHLNDLGAEVIIGTRALHRNIAANERVIALHKMHDYQAWLDAIDGVDCVINTVGILRQRFGESYEQVHHHAVAKLASACQTKDSKLIHISALGLQSDVRSRFMHSKLDGEAALRKSAANWFIVRPSIVDGLGGYGAKWFRRAAQWPIHLVPANALGRVAPIDVNDLGEAVAHLALAEKNPKNLHDREYDLGGEDHFTLSGYLDALATQPALLKIRVPAALARALAHFCDIFHATPFSYGHYELLKYDNLPRRNRLIELLGRPATKIGTKYRDRANGIPQPVSAAA